MRRSSRTTFSFPDFSLRRLLLQGARVARGSPPLGQRLCDVEKGNGKNDKNSASSSSGATNKVSFYIRLLCA
jgi:E3 ubiquitin-protein ligase RNF19A